MSRDFKVIKDGYLPPKADQRQHIQSRGEYDFHLFDNTSGGYNNTVNINKVLSPEIDIFSELPEDILEVPQVRLFLAEMKRRILERYLRDELIGVTLPKLRVSEKTDETIVVEWIFNYFRLYFYFDKNDAAYYGSIVRDEENDGLENVYRKMSESEFQEVANAEVDFAVMMAGGGV